MISNARSLFKNLIIYDVNEGDFELECVGDIVIGIEKLDRIENSSYNGKCAAFFNYSKLSLETIIKYRFDIKNDRVKLVDLESDIKLLIGGYKEIIEEKIKEYIKTTVQWKMYIQDKKDQ